MVVIGQSGCNRVKIFLLGQSGSIGSKVFYSGTVYLDKVVVFGQK